MPGSNCRNCGTVLQGRWCHACGQKRLEPADRTLRALLGEFLAAFTNLDGRVVRSFARLLAQPGRLAGDYLDGVRARYLSPVTLFLTVNVLYFFAPSLTDFSLPLGDHLRGQFHSPLARALVESRLAGRGVELADYAQRFNAEIVNLAKLFILLHVPLLALGLALLHVRRARPFADHVLVAFWFMAFMLLHFLLTPQLLAVLLDLAGLRFSSTLLSVALLGPLLLWTLFLLRGAYAQSTALALLKTPGVIVMAMAAHFIYRSVLFMVTYLRT